eukprot:TRINITY_DN3046_c1_g1_i2.p1 TRINITY_DN3046_c1_g1~~TRINITY_DN3046_c1_g1_i2.p1  ORF type:complete len:206 (+),score=66.32 TRINITY_DN3046_c1_g1_i2:108-725(+)
MIADSYGLAHSSTGPKSARQLTLTKQNLNEIIINEQNGVWELLRVSKYICLLGIAVNVTALQPCQINIPQSYIANRIRRDGTENHITLITSNELTQLIQNFNNTNNNDNNSQRVTLSTTEITNLIFDSFKNNIIDDWIDLGLGYAKTLNSKGEIENEAFFRIIDWPSAQRCREMFGLALAQFHITIGFKKFDIHNCDKTINSKIE